MVSATRESKDYAFTLGAGNYQTKDAQNGNTNITQLEFKAAYRSEITNFTYIDVGWDYSWNNGYQPKMNPNVDYTTGPMIGLVRHFPHFLLTAFVMPVQYQYNRDNGNSVKGWSFLENGGVGVVYLFQ